MQWLDLVLKHSGDDRHVMRSLDELADVFAALAGDADVRVVLATGDGDYSFQDPAVDLVLESRSDPSAQIHALDVAHLTVQRIIDLDKPLISAINGPAFGVGTQVALLSDFVLAVDRAYFQDPHVKLGVAAGDGGVAIWPLVMGLTQAKKYLLTGCRLSAAEAFKLGAISNLVAPNALASNARALADELAAFPAYAVQMTKRALNQWIRAASPTSFDYANALQLASSLHPDSISRLDAIVGKNARRQLWDA